jgi:serine/threonine protein kinase/tetratricopeptide (TPR) repeat protein
MPRQWRCANGHTWAGELGALTFCPDCGTNDVYEVRPEYHSVEVLPGADDSVGHTFVQAPLRSPTADDTYMQPVMPPAAKVGDTLIQGPVPAASAGDTVVQPIVSDTLMQRVPTADPGTTEEQAYLRKDGESQSSKSKPATDGATFVQAPVLPDPSTLEMPLEKDNATLIQSPSARSNDLSLLSTMTAPPAGTTETRVFTPATRPADGNAPADSATAPTLDGTGLDAPAFRTADYMPTVGVPKSEGIRQVGLSQQDTRLAPPPKPREPKPGGPPPVEGYEILGTLGRGGMGVVYKARQIKLNRVVALKMILAGGHAGAYERQRFVTEMHAVAALTHPNIVQIYETGERDGLPFFSLEYCDGGSLQQRLRGQPLAPKAAADIVEQLAHAMQYAHERGIVHRDLKPANILFTGGEDQPASKDRPTPSKDSRPTAKDSKGSAESLKTMTQSKTGQSKTYSSSATTRTSTSSPSLRSSRAMPKVTDFGLAKRLEEDSGLTGSGTILGTPSYMAPEQAAGRTKAVGPPADIHALGAILYEMLTGRPPFLGESAVETMNQVRTLDPVPPSRIQPKTPRDLETICLKCLQKEMHKRYATAGDMADDLHRFLDGHPIAARPAPFWEKGWKWAKRRPAQAALIAVCVTGLIGAAVGGMMFGRFKAEQAEVQKELTEKAFAAFRQSEANFKSAREAVDSLLVRVGTSKLEKFPKAERLRRDLLEQSLEFYNRFLHLHGDDPAVRREAGWAYQRVGRIRNDLGDRKAAISAYQKSAELFDGLAREPSDQQTGDKFDLAQTQRQLAIVLEADGRQRDADAAYDSARASLRELADSNSDRPAYRAQLANLLLNRGLLYYHRRRLAEAEDLLRQSLAEYEQLCRDASSSANRYGRAKAEANLGAVALAADRIETAMKELNTAVEWLGVVVKEEPDNPEYANDLGQAEFNLAGAFFKAGKNDDARRTYENSIARLSGLAKDHPNVEDFRLSLAIAHDNYAVFLKTTAGLRAAEPQRQQARALYDELRRDFPDNLDYSLHYAIDLDEHAIYLSTMDRLDEAIAEEKIAVDLLGGLAAADPRNPDIGRLVRENARRHLNLGQLYAQKHQSEEADAEYALAVSLLQGPADRRLRGDESWYDLPAVYMNQAKLYEEQRRAKSVERCVRQAVAVSRQIVAAHPDQADALSMLASAEFNLGSLPTIKSDETLAMTRDAVARQRAALKLAPKRADLIVAMGIYGARLVTLLADQGDHAAAAAAAAELSLNIPEWRGWPVVAGQLARCVRLARTDTHLSGIERTQQSAAYGRQALDLLTKAVAGGYKDANALKDSPELEVLRTDPAFKPAFDKILADIDARNKK